MITEKALLGYLINTLSRIKVMQIDKDTAIRYIDRYLAQKDCDKNIAVLFGRVKMGLVRKTISAEFKRKFVYMMQRARKVNYK